MRKLIALLLALVTVVAMLAFVSACTPDDKPEPEKPAVVVAYSKYGAVGDGVTDDFAAIIAAHEDANKNGYHIAADPGAVYYIGASNKTAYIKTNTDWGDAQFIIDDSGFVANRNAWSDAQVFNISPSLGSSLIDTVKTLRKNQEKLDLTLQQSTVLVATDDNVKRYIRRGQNANTGASQTDVFVVDKKGNVDMNAPIIWDFDDISSLRAYPIDEKTLTVKGGEFTTIANTGNADNNYMKRGIAITRSNAVVDGLRHNITGEGTQAAPYDGFIKLENCAYVTIKNSTLTGHQGYAKPSDPGNIRGTYDINANRTVNMQVINCDQTNDIQNSKWWGIFTSNYSKNIIFDTVKFSRFDAHQGVYNTTIRNSELGWQGVSIIGAGLLTVENTRVSGTNFIYFRDDYGSTWNGDVEITDCSFNPGSSLTSAQIIHTNNDGMHDFGYECAMPTTITIDGFTVEDGNASGSYSGVYLVGAVNRGASETSPYALTETIFLSNYQSAKPYRMPSTYIQGRIQVVAF